MKRQYPKFTQLFLLVLIFMTTLVSCKNNQEAQEPIESTDNQTENQELFFQISLAQWSLSKPIFEGKIDPMDFAKKANEMGFSGIEYVSGLYTAEIEKSGLTTVLDTLKARSQQYEVENVLIMIDGEGDLAVSEEAERNKAVENHKKWVDAAEFLGAHSIRVNLFGTNDAEQWKANATDGLRKLSEYAATKNINVLVENHGYLSSNAALLVEVIKEVNLPNCGTLPDFGNFCLEREGGERWEAKCIEEYPRYQGVQEMMPYAKAVSAKSYAFDEAGKETTIDYGKILKIVKEAGYTGFIGIEYEGQELSAEEGIMATKELLIAEGSKL